MNIETKIRLLQKGGQARVLALVNHPMLAGDGSTAADYIDSMVFELNGVRVAEMRLGPGVDDNPLTGILIEPVQAGDRIDVRWSDTHGRAGSAQATAK